MNNDKEDNFNIDTKKLTGMIFNRKFNQTIFKAILSCDWTGKVIDRQWAYTEKEAIKQLRY